MSTTNPVFQVLIPTGDQAPLAKGSRVTALAPGQIGVFNQNTGLSVDATSDAKDLKEIFFAVGQDYTGSGTLEDIKQSAGQCIQKANLRTRTFKAYAQSKPKIVDIKNFQVKYNTEFVIKVEYRNQAIYRQQGYVQFTKPFAIYVGPNQTECPTCPAVTPTDMAKAFKAKINADPDKLAKADLIDYTTTPATPVVIADGDVAAWLADVANANKHLGIRVTSINVPRRAWTGNIPMNSQTSQEVDIIVSLLEDGFSGTGTTATVFQNLQFEEGHGEEIALQEYESLGFQNRTGLYRLSELNGVERMNINYGANKVSGKYHQLVFEYDFVASAGWEEAKRNLQTIIAVPEGDDTTLAGLAAIVDVVFDQFSSIADDITARVAEPNVAKAASTAVDGLE
jgi:hypothetical protein